MSYNFDDRDEPVDYEEDTPIKDEEGDMPGESQTIVDELVDDNHNSSDSSDSEESDSEQSPTKGRRVKIPVYSPEEEDERRDANLAKRVAKREAKQKAKGEITKKKNKHRLREEQLKSMAAKREAASLTYSLKREKEEKEKLAAEIAELKQKLEASENQIDSEANNVFNKAKAYIGQLKADHASELAALQSQIANLHDDDDAENKLDWEGLQATQTASQAQTQPELSLAHRLRHKWPKAAPDSSQTEARKTGGAGRLTADQFRRVMLTADDSELDYVLNDEELEFGIQRLKDANTFRKDALRRTPQEAKQRDEHLSWKEEMLRISDNEKAEFYNLLQLPADGISYFKSHNPDLTRNDVPFFFSCYFPELFITPAVISTHTTPFVDGSSSTGAEAPAGAMSETPAVVNAPPPAATTTTVSDPAVVSATQGGASTTAATNPTVVIPGASAQGAAGSGGGQADIVGQLQTGDHGDLRARDQGGSSASLPPSTDQTGRRLWAPESPTRPPTRSDRETAREFTSPGFKQQMVDLGAGNGLSLTTAIYNSAQKKPELYNFSKQEVAAYEQAINDHRRLGYYLAEDRATEFRDQASRFAFELTLSNPGIRDLLGSRLRNVIDFWRNRRPHSCMDGGEPCVSDEDFILAVKIIFNQGVGSAANAGGTPFQRAEIDCKNIVWRFNGDTSDSYMPCLREFINLQMTYERDLVAAEKDLLIKSTLDRVLLINADVVDKLVETIRVELKIMPSADRSLGWLQARLASGFMNIIKVRNNDRLIGHEPGPIRREKRKAERDEPIKGKSKGDRKDYSDRNKSDKPSSSDNTDKGEHVPKCYGCGRTGHVHKNCTFKGHPNFNKETGKPWVDSEGGKFWKNLGEDILPYSIKKVADSEPHKRWAASQAAAAKANKASKKGSGDDKKRKRGTLEPSLDILDTYDNDKAIIASIVSKSHNDDYLLPVTVHYPNGTTRVYRALVDTGALHSDYCSHAVGLDFTQHGLTPLPCNTRVGGALGSSQVARQKFCIMLTLKNEVTKQNEKLPFVVTEINIEYDLIIGRPSIQKYGLLRKLESHFLGEEGSEAPVFPHTEVVRNQLNSHQRVSNLRSLEPATKYLDPIEVSDGIEFREEDAPWQREINSEPAMTGLPDRIEGSPEERAQLRTLLEKYSTRFSSALQPEPMKVDEPMEIKVDMDKWDALKANKAPPRVMSMQKNDEIRRQLDKMLEQGVIRKSKADKYSQVLLTPKPNGKWRFCVDYVNLNTCTEREGWPIPNIQQMLRRIGSTDPNYFAVMDLTSGYHQAPVHPASIWLTAFITIYGLFEWLRVPMGLKGAPSYFQKVMATVVLIGLLHVLCEL